MRQVNSRSYYTLSHTLSSTRREKREFRRKHHILECDFPVLRGQNLRGLGVYVVQRVFV